MTITTDEFKKIDNGFQDNSSASFQNAEYRLQKILGLLAMGDTLHVEDINMELKTISEFKEFVKGKYYFGHLDIDNLLSRWRNKKLES